MKLLLIFILLFSLTGCNDTKKDTISDTRNDTKEEQEVKEPETITLNEYGHMDSEFGTYELIYDGYMAFKVEDDYLIDMFAIEFEEELYANSEIGTVHIDGQFKYSDGDKNYITKLNTIEGNFFYMGKGGKDSFQIDVKGNQIRYWLYSTDNATLIIHKIWSFTPY